MSMKLITESRQFKVNGKLLDCLVVVSVDHAVIPTKDLTDNQETLAKINSGELDEVDILVQATFGPMSGFDSLGGVIISHNWVYGEATTKDELKRIVRDHDMIECAVQSLELNINAFLDSLEGE